MDIIVNALSFLILLSVLVSVHEWGHYYAAKRSGVIIKQFSIGFGPKIFSKKDKNGVLWSFSLIPLGGFVEMLDESSRHNGETGKSFSQTTYLQKVMILLGGPVMNLVLGFFLFLALSYTNTSALGSFVKVKEGSPAFNAGIPEKAMIKSVNGKEITTFNQLFSSLVTVNGDSLINVTFIPEGEKEPVSAKIDISKISFSARKSDHLEKIGFEPMIPKIKNKIGQVLDGSIAQQSGLKVGDSIIKVGNQEIHEWLDLSAAINNVYKKNMDNNALKPFDVKITILRNGEKLEIPFSFTKKDQKLGVYPVLDGESYIVEFDAGIADVFTRAYNYTKDSALMVFKTTGKLISGDISIDSMSSPIGIAKATGDSVRSSLAQSLFLSALISVNLFVFNILPIPALDGGRLVICSIEAAIGRPLPKYIMSFAIMFSIALILSLTIYSFYNDLKDIM